MLAKQIYFLILDNQFEMNNKMLQNVRQNNYNFFVCNVSVLGGKRIIVLSYILYNLWFIPSEFDRQRNLIPLFSNELQGGLKKSL